MQISQLQVNGLKQEYKVIVTAKDINGDSFPCAINITDTAFAKKFDISYEPVYLCIPGKPKNTEGISQYIKYIYTDK